MQITFKPDDPIVTRSHVLQVYNHILPSSWAANYGIFQQNKNLERQKKKKLEAPPVSPIYGTGSDSQRHPSATSGAGFLTHNSCINKTEVPSWICAMHWTIWQCEALPLSWGSVKSDRTRVYGNRHTVSEQSLKGRTSAAVRFPHPPNMPQALNLQAGMSFMNTDKPSDSDEPSEVAAVSWDRVAPTVCEAGPPEVQSRNIITFTLIFHQDPWGCSVSPHLSCLKMGPSIPYVHFMGYPKGYWTDERLAAWLQCEGLQSFSNQRHHI